MRKSRDYKAEYKKRSKAYRAAKRCLGCGGLPLVTKTRCERCRQLLTESAKSRREWLVSQGLCVDCRRRRLGSDAQRCQKCTAKATDATRRRRM